MRVSTKGRYGVRALVDIAMHLHESPVVLRDVARRQQISLHYLEQIFVRLRAADLVNSTRGAQGGFTLARPPDDIKLSEVVHVLEGSVAPARCVDDPASCERSNTCAFRDLWTEMGAAMNRVLESASLQDLAERQMAKEQHEAPVYYI